MNEFELAKMIDLALTEAQKESVNYTFVLKPKTIQKAQIMQFLLKDFRYTLNFDGATNSLEISFNAYVFDSTYIDLAKVFRIVDVYVIDALKDGRICIEMKLLNAALKIRRDPNV